MLQSALKAGLALGFAATAMGAEASALKPATFADLPGWKNDKHGEVVVAFRRSCERMLIADPEAAISNHGIGGKFKDWKAACEALRQVDVNDHEAVRAFFETHFQPWQTLNKIEKKVRVKGKGKRKRTKTVVSYANTKGMCTGYYDAWMKGSLVQDEVYTVPVFAPPPDKEKWSRRQIMTGEWPHNDKAIAYVKSFVDVLYLQIQGSGVIELPDGGQIRLQRLGVQRLDTG
ncbi:MAG TPA: MltA domain-containing protein, partial [Alphaproteobacteria bacterium]|nr:MltA domain-containing protein [Alphaproteobacteria bacterium]